MRSRVCTPEIVRGLGSARPVYQGRRRGVCVFWCQETAAAKAQISLQISTCKQFIAISSQGKSWTAFGEIVLPGEVQAHRYCPWYQG